MKEESESLTKSKTRVKDLGEVFTPAVLVSEMLDKLPPDCWLPDKVFLEPSCGTGNFLVQILQRKIDAGATPLQALSTLYGVDIMKDNVIESRKRLFQIALNNYLELDSISSALKTLKRNIIVGNTLEMDFDLDWPCARLQEQTQLRQHATAIKMKKPRRASVTLRAVSTLVSPLAAVTTGVKKIEDVAPNHDLNEIITPSVIEKVEANYNQDNSNTQLPIIVKNTDPIKENSLCEISSILQSKQLKFTGNEKNNYWRFGIGKVGTGIEIDHNNRTCALIFFGKNADRRLSKVEQQFSNFKKSHNHLSADCVNVHGELRVGVQLNMPEYSSDNVDKIASTIIEVISSFRNEFRESIRAIDKE